LGTAGKSGKHHYHACGTYLKRGREACPALLLNKDKLEQAVLDEIQGHFLKEENARKSNTRAGSNQTQAKCRGKSLGTRRTGC